MLKDQIKLYREAAGLSKAELSRRTCGMKTKCHP